MMEARTLGTDGPAVSAIGLGTWAIGGPFWEGGDRAQPLGWGEVDDAESIRTIETALDCGITLFDTAAAYGAGHSERMLGRALRGRRGEATIATKFGFRFDDQTRATLGVEPRPEALAAACEASLQRLGIDAIDLYQLHISDCDPDDAMVLRAELEQLVERGLIRAYAWSTDDPERAALWADGAHCAAVQHALHVLADAPEMLALCEQHGLASLNRSPLAMGLLTGKWTASSTLPADDVRGSNPEWLTYFADGRPSPEWLALVSDLREILTANGHTLGQAALAWILARSPAAIPIPGARTPEQVLENARVLELGPLTAEQMAQVAALLGREHAVR